MDLSFHVYLLLDQNQNLCFCGMLESMVHISMVYYIIQILVYRNVCLQIYSYFFLTV